MKTDIILLYSDGSGMEDALAQTEKIASYAGLSHRDTLHLRLLTEEMLCMMRSIAGRAEGSFWVENAGDLFELHLKVNKRMDILQKEQLLAASTSGKNEAARGLMGRLRVFFDPLDDVPAFYNMAPGGVHTDMSWSLQDYQHSLRESIEQHDAVAVEEWDELEKSVVSHVADDVKVSVIGREAEMIILKKTGENA